MAPSKDTAGAETSYGSQSLDTSYCVEDTSSEVRGGTQQHACCSCPDGAICNKGATIETILVDAGFWRAGPKTAEVWDCGHESACEHEVEYSTENSTLTNAYCYDGYQGNVGLRIIAQV